MVANRLHDADVTRAPPRYEVIGKCCAFPSAAAMLAFSSREVSLGFSRNLPVARGGTDQLEVAGDQCHYADKSSSIDRKIPSRGQVYS